MSAGPLPRATRPGPLGNQDAQWALSASCRESVQKIERKRTGYEGEPITVGHDTSITGVSILRTEGLALPTVRSQGGALFFEIRQTSRRDGDVRYQERPV